VPKLKKLGLKKLGLKKLGLKKLELGPPIIRVYLVIQIILSNPAMPKFGAV
jgi:hypothetical protein